MVTIPTWVLLAIVTSLIFIAAALAVISVLITRKLKRERWYFREPYAWLTKSPLIWESAEFIRNLERSFGISLTAHAREMLLIPLAEQYELTGELNFREVQESLHIMIRAIAEQGPERREGEQIRSSLAVIRAYWKTFCNIPPFCSRIEG